MTKSLFFFLICLPFFGQAQSLPFRTDTLIIPITVLQNTDQQNINWDANAIQYYSNYQPLANIHTIQLEDAALQVQFSFTTNNPGLSSTAKLYATENNQISTPLLLQEKEISDKKSTTLYQLDWLDATETILKYEDEKDLVLELSYFAKDIDCSTAPSFTFQKQWPHYAAALAGLGTIALGQSFQSRANEAYAEYEDLWEIGGSEAAAAPLLTTAKNHKTSYQIISYTGLGIIAIDAIWMTVRLINHQIRKKKFNQFCKPNPSKNMDLSTHYSPIDGEVGFQLILKF